MIWNWSFWYSDERHTWAKVTKRPSFAQTFSLWRTVSSFSYSSMRAPTSRIWSRTSRAAFSTARPEMYVVEEA